MKNLIKQFKIYLSCEIALFNKWVENIRQTCSNKIKPKRIIWPKWSSLKIDYPKIELPKLPFKLPELPELPSYRLPKIDFKLSSATKNKIKKYAGYSSQFALICVLGILTSTALVTAKEYAEISGVHFGINQSDTSALRKITALNPASGQNAVQEPLQKEKFQEEIIQVRFPIEETSIDAQAVLVPNASTVISSSRDGRIEKINFDNGDLFRKGDVLVEYGCEDVRAEIEIAKSEEALTNKKSISSAKLFKLDIISDFEKLEIETKDKQAAARVSLFENKLEDCFIRADYDGRVVKRLGNPGEYTRTDRVIMEIASLDYLEAEFLLPSKWLRWVNVGAPVRITVNETESSYDAVITRIYGEIDPVSQSIQMSARLNPYTDPLLPGMSGQIVLDIPSIQEVGIKGFLETGPVP